MSFSFRRWASHSTPSSTVCAPESRSHASAEEHFLKGLSLASGQGVPRDYARAAQCYAEAADHGHSGAQFNLAMLYEQGRGVPRDEGRALAWLTKAANRGNADAQFRLGVRQHLAFRAGRKGASIEGRIEALKWVRLSALQKHRDAEGACEFVALGMTREEVDESRQRVITFTPVQPGTEP